MIPAQSRFPSGSGNKRILVILADPCHGMNSYPVFSPPLTQARKSGSKKKGHSESCSRLKNKPFLLKNPASPSLPGTGGSSFTSGRAIRGSRTAHKDPCLVLVESKKMTHLLPEDFSGKLLHPNTKNHMLVIGEKRIIFLMPSAPGRWYRQSVRAF